MRGTGWQEREVSTQEVLCPHCCEPGGTGVRWGVAWRAPGPWGKRVRVFAKVPPVYMAGDSSLCADVEPSLERKQDTAPLTKEPDSAE